MTISTDLAIIRHARVLLAKGWTQHAMRRDAQGAIAVGGHAAVAWCLVGAIDQAVYDSPDDAEQVGDTPTEILADMVAITLWRWANRIDLIGWQDEPGSTQAELLELMDLTIRDMEATE